MTQSGIEGAEAGADPERVAASPARRRPHPGRFMAAGAAVAWALVAVVVALYGADKEGMTLVNRYLARIGFPVFILAYVASALHRLGPSALSRFLMRERRGIGLCYAAIHLTHAVAIMVLWGVTWEHFFPDASVFIGGMGFVLLVAMTLTSNDAAQRRLGMKRWRILHRTGIYYLAFIYLASYGGRLAVGDQRLLGAYGTAVLVTATGLRFAAFLRTRSRRRSAGAAPSPGVAG